MEAEVKKIKTFSVVIGLLVIMFILYAIFVLLPSELRIFFYIFLTLLFLGVVYVLYKCFNDAEFKQKTISITASSLIWLDKLGSQTMDAIFEKKSKKSKKKRIPISNKVKSFILNRANNSCQACGTLRALEIHHIDENPANNNKNNLIVLCATCHRGGGFNKIQLKNLAQKAYTKERVTNIYMNK